MSFFSSRELQHLCSLQQISTEDSTVLPQFIIQSSRKNFCSLKSKIFKDHQKENVTQGQEFFTISLIMGKLDLSSRQQEIARQG